MKNPYHGEFLRHVEPYVKPGTYTLRRIAKGNSQHCRERGHQYRMTDNPVGIKCVGCEAQEELVSGDAKALEEATVYLAKKLIYTPEGVTW